MVAAVAVVAGVAVVAVVALAVAVVAVVAVVALVTAVAAAGAGAVVVKVQLCSLSGSERLINCCRGSWTRAGRPRGLGLGNCWGFRRLGSRVGV